MNSITFFNNKGGVGKTTLVYHVAWMYALLGKRVLAVDLDPQANLTSMYLEENMLEELFEAESGTSTIYQAFRPLLDGVGDISEVRLREITPSLYLLPGDLALSAVEDELSSQWPGCLDGKPRAFRVISAIWRIVRQSAARVSADIVLMDVGPNLGSLNRASLIAADFVVLPLAPDLYSLQGLKNLGPTLVRWRGEWDSRRKAGAGVDLELPTGRMMPLGYVVLQHAVRADRPVKAYNRWISRIPGTYSASVDRKPPSEGTTVGTDANCLATLKNYRSLMPLSQEAHKPMFCLRASDGALGGHALAVQDCYADFRNLVRHIDDRITQHFGN